MTTFEIDTDKLYSELAATLIDVQAGGDEVGILLRLWKLESVVEINSKGAGQLKFEESVVSERLQVDMLACRTLYEDLIPVSASIQEALETACFMLFEKRDAQTLTQLYDGWVGMGVEDALRSMATAFQATFVYAQDVQDVQDVHDVHDVRATFDISGVIAAAEGHLCECGLETRYLGLLPTEYTIAVPAIEVAGSASGDMDFVKYCMRNLIEMSGQLRDFLHNTKLQAFIYEAVDAAMYVD